MAEAIAAYEASPEVSPFSSKFDAYLAGSAELSEAERRGGQPAASIDGRMGWQMGRRSERDRKAPRRFA
jgi:hypothetical protein